MRRTLAAIGTIATVSLLAAGSAAAAPNAKRVTPAADVQFTLECTTHSSTSVPDAIETYMTAVAVVDGTGKTRYIETDIVNGKDIDPKLATAKVTTAELPGQGGYSYELNGQFNEPSENSPHEACDASRIYRTKPAAEVIRPAVTVTEYPPVESSAPTTVGK